MSLAQVKHNPISVLVMAAGTGGHVFPGLAVAQALIEQGVSVAWLGTPDGFEQSRVMDAHIPYYSIRMSGLRGKGLSRWLAAPFKLVRAFIESVKIIRSIRPRAVLAMGGYVCAPAGLAARVLGVPLVIHEQNAIAGLTNVCLAPFSRAIFSGFENQLSRYRKFYCVGNPLRSDLINQARSLVFPAESSSLGTPLKLLVLGGSLGARTLNQWVPEALASFVETDRPEVWHQTGERHLSRVQASYHQLGLSAKIVAFIESMHEAYAWADLIVCRAGALTVSEISAMALPAILVPYPYAVDDHQRANAQILVDRGAAIMITEPQTSADTLSTALSHLIGSPKKLLNMRRSAWRYRDLTATDAVVQYLRAL